MREKLSLAEIRNHDDAAEMMKARNSVRQYMTHNQNEITESEQREWFAEYYIPARWRRQAIGFLAVKDEATIGYGLITQRNDRYWVSGGLVPEARGQGNGRELFGHLTTTVHGYLESDECWLDVLNTNDRAINLYKSLGYQAVESDQRLTLMVHQQFKEAA